MRRRFLCLLALCAALSAAAQDSFVQRASEALARHESSEVVRIAGEGLRQGENPELRNLLGKGYAQAGQMDKAVPELKTAIRLAPGNEGFRFDLARLFLYHQDFQAAIGVLEDARKQLPRSAQIELALGVAYYGQRRFEDTVQAFLTTIDLAPDVPQPYVFLGRMLEHAGTHMPEITEKFAAWERLEPQNPEAPLLHAKALVAQLPPTGWGAKAGEVQALLEKSISLKSDSAEAQFELGCLMERKHDYPKAAELLEKSIQLDPQNPVAHYRLARVYDRLGKKEQADAERALHERLSAREKQDLDRRAGGMASPQ